MSVTTSDAVRRALASAAAAGEAGARAVAGGQGGEQPAQQDQEGSEGAAGERDSANAPGTELQQLRADVQALRESCDQLVPRLQEVVVVCDTLQEKNAEHETLWAAIAPKLVRLDALLDTHANAPLGGQSGISGQTESVGQKQTAKRVSSLWAKDHVRRWYACLLYTSPSPRDRTRSRMPSSA